MGGGRLPSRRAFASQREGQKTVPVSQSSAGVCEKVKDEGAGIAKTELQGLKLRLVSGKLTMVEFFSLKKLFCVKRFM